MQSTKKALVRKEEGSATAGDDVATLASSAGLNIVPQVSLSR